MILQPSLFLQIIKNKEKDVKDVLKFLEEDGVEWLGMIMEEGME